MRSPQKDNGPLRVLVDEGNVPPQSDAEKALIYSNIMPDSQKCSSPPKNFNVAQAIPVMTSEKRKIKLKRRKSNLSNITNSAQAPDNSTIKQIISQELDNTMIQHHRNGAPGQVMTKFNSFVDDNIQVPDSGDIERGAVYPVSPVAFSDRKVAKTSTATAPNAIHDSQLALQPQTGFIHRTP